MYGFPRKEDGDYKKQLITNSAAATPSSQKPSPTSTSSDDASKGENTHNHDGGTGTNSNRYARNKSGLKPIRPTNVSASNLNPITPGRQLPHTPRLNFKENELPRFGMHDFPSTPKLGRSESTPELHRIKRSDHLLHTVDRNTAQEKTCYSNVLQETSVSNLFSLTSDSLPDIFRKPIIQQQPDIALNLQSKFSQSEDKVSRWGYGPSSSMNIQQGFGIKTLHSDCHKELPTKLLAEGHLSLPQVQEESHPVDVLKPCLQQTNLHGTKNGDWNQPRKPLVLNCKVPFMPPEKEEPVSSTTKLLDKSDSNTTSDTAIMLGIPTQLTVKMHPSDDSRTPIAKQLSWTGHSSFSTTKAQEPHIVSSVSSSKPENRINEPSPSPSLLLTKPDSASLLVLNSADFKRPLPEKMKHTASISEVQPLISNHQNIEQQKMLHSVVSSSNHLLPQTPRQPTKSKQISVNGKLYTVMKLLGRGGSSVVYQVLNQEMTDIFALKVVRLDSVDEVTAEGYINEVRLLKQLQGLPRVVRLLEYEYNEEEEKLLLVMEKGDTDLANLIRNRTSLNAINPTLIRFYWQEMLEAVKEIHDKNVIHTDLKPANFLLVNGGLKLIDFGIATSIQADMTSIMKDSQCGTYNYMAPEAIKSASPAGANHEYKISRKTDVWSLGCMLYSLIYKNPPFNKIRDTIEKINAIVDERHIIDFPPTADPMAISVLKGCLDRNARNRLSIEQLLSHPYLTCAYQPQVQSTQAIPHQIRIQLQFLLDGGQLTEEEKENIRRWM
ncbi:probable serine/threonine-protein kinase dyrk2 [Daphnia carinata]|uniref:probable serine/threonine-protein kinase dyrk2 n=1 Tax=Daphnia carinata TaxID=120202 RepID=UPI002580FBDA|nr:probable serine/threonine-protein kinase dyrk2 [Daphnia carinata]